MNKTSKTLAAAVFIVLIIMCFFKYGEVILAQENSSQVVENHYSPAEDLEAIDLKLLDQAKYSIDISTYAMDDQAIANELLKKANAGVHIKIYRDLRQYDGEIARPNNETAMFAGNKNVEIRIKHSSVLAHLKAYVVDFKQVSTPMLREGSANWSVSGEKQQDNSLLIIRDQAAVNKFESNFNTIWNRPDNKVIQ